MFEESLKQARKAKGLSQLELAQRLGVSQQAVGKWERGKSTPDPEMLVRIAEILSTTADDLLGLHQPGDAVREAEERFFGTRQYYPIPVIGTVKAGYGGLAFEEDYGVEFACVKDPEQYFFLVVKGDSMEPRIFDGDLALVHRQATLEDGDLGILVYGPDGEGTLKKFMRRGSAVVLRAFNPAYEDKILKGEDLAQLYVAGRVVETKARW